MRGWRVFVRSLRAFPRTRFVASSALHSEAGATRVRSKGYGPTKDLLRGIDTTKQLLVETDLHPADAEMQRCILSLTSPDVKVYTPLDGEADSAETSGAFDHEGIAAISPEQLASVATVIVDQVREQLELSSYVSEAAQDGRAGSVVNAVASCLKEEMERLFVVMQSHEVSFAHLLQNNSNVICERVAGVIQTNNFLAQPEKDRGESKQLSLFMRDVSTAVTNLETLLKTKLDTVIATEGADTSPLIEEMRAHLVEVIEQSSRAQHENLLLALRDMNFVSTTPGETKNAARPEEVQDLVKSAMSHVVDEAKREVQELLGAMREKLVQQTDSVTAEGCARQSALEGMLASYGERLKEMKASSASLVDIKELVMDLHSQQQTNEMAISEVGESVKKLKKELKQALSEVTFAASAAETALAKDSADQLPEHSDRLDDLVERVTSDVIQQLKKHFLNVNDLSKQILALEKTIKKEQKAELASLQLLHEADDVRLIALAQSISDSILASLPRQEEHQRPFFTKSELAEAVAEVLCPKLDELATALTTKTNDAAQRLEVSSRQVAGEGFAFFDEQQLVTLAQTIAESVRDMLQTVKLSGQEMENISSEGEGVRAVVERLDDLKKSILTTLKMEMERTHEVDITPFQIYIDEVLEGFKEVLCKRQEEAHIKAEGLAEVLLERLGQQNVLLQELRDKHRKDEDVIAHSGVKSEASATEGWTILSENLLKEVRKIAAEESAATFSSLDAVRNEVRDAAEKLPLVVEEKLSKLEASFTEAQKTEKDHSALLQSTLEDMRGCIVSASDESSSAKQLLESINNAVSDLTQQGASSAADIKSHMTASEGRAASLHAQTTAALSQRLVNLHEELQNGKRQLEELVSFSLEYKGVASAVGTMQVKLEEATSLLDGINNLLAKRLPQGQLSEDMEAGETISARLDRLSAASHNILSELREHRLATKREESDAVVLPTAGDARPTNHSLEEMEARLNERLRVLQEKLDEAVHAGLDVAPAVDVVVPSQDKTLDEGRNNLLDEIDALVKLLHGSRGAQVKQVRDRLIALRLVVETNHNQAQDGDTERLLEALKENYLKLKEDVTEAEVALVGELSSKMEKVLESNLTSIDRSITLSTESLVQKLQSEVDSSEKAIKFEQKQLAIELHDRLNKLESTLEVCVAGIKDGIHKNLAEKLHDTVQQATVCDIPMHVKGAVENVCMEQFQSLRDRIDGLGTLGEQNTAQLVSRVQQISQDISNIGGITGDVRAVVSENSAGVLEQVRRTGETLTEKLELHFATLKQQLPAFVATSLSGDAYKYTHKEVSAASVGALQPLSLWSLLVLSFVIIASIMACAYFIFAAFLVAFVPLPLQITQPADESLANDDFFTQKRPPSTRVVDRVML